MFGVVGDRIGHRDLLAMMRATYAVLATTLMTLALTGTLSPLYVFIIAALMGLVRPSDLGVRGALVATIMPHDQLIGAISISRTTMDTARIAGALSGAGLFAALGMGPAYVAIVSLYIAATLLTLCVIAPSKPHPVDEVAERSIAAFADARPEGGHRLCLDHAADARRDLGRVPRQPDRLSADQRIAALYRADDLRHQPDRARISVGQLRQSARWSARSR